MADALDRIPKPSLPAAPPPAPYAGSAAPHLRESESDNESDSDPRDENAASAQEDSHALHRPEKI